MAPSRHTLDALARLAAAEERFLRSDFLAPALRGGCVQVRVAGVRCRLRVEPRDYEGWGVFRPVSAGVARFVRGASLAERRQYLDLFPRLRLILCRRERGRWQATPAHRADTRFGLPDLLPVHLVEEAQLFEVIVARHDGGNCWFDEPDGRHDPGAAAYLRQALSERVPLASLRRRGLTAEERTAYVLAYRPEVQAALHAGRDGTEARLREALAHAGATLRGYVERDAGFRVEYEVDGERHISVVGKQDLTVQAAGICLSGEDAHFDLHSLVGVLREARGEFSFED